MPQVVVLHGGRTRFNGSHSELVDFAAAMAPQEPPQGEKSTNAPGDAAANAPGVTSANTPGETSANTPGDIAPEADAVASTVTFSAFLSGLMAVHQEEGSDKEQHTPGGQASTKEAMAVSVHD